MRPRAALVAVLHGGPSPPPAVTRPFPTPLRPCALPAQDGSCRLKPGWALDAGTGLRCKPVIGDGIVLRGEDASPIEYCDDGNRADGDGCSSRGLIEYGYVCPRAGRCPPLSPPPTAHNTSPALSAGISASRCCVRVPGV